MGFDSSVNPLKCLRIALRCRSCYTPTPSVHGTATGLLVHSYRIMQYHITLQHIVYTSCDMMTLSQDQTHIYAVGSVTVQLQRKGQEVAAAVGCFTTI